jgi:predicted nucleotidyltransferase
MMAAGLSPAELSLILGVFRKHPEIQSVILFGSRAKGTHSNRSDVDLAITGDISSLGAEAIASDLEELPLPYRFEVQALKTIKHRALLEHIHRVGMEIYNEDTTRANRKGLGYE